MHRKTTVEDVDDDYMKADEVSAVNKQSVLSTTITKQLRQNQKARHETKSVVSKDNESSQSNVTPERQKFEDDHNQRQNFNQKYMDAGSDKVSSEYLNSISRSIGLEDLSIVVDNCYYNKSHDMVAVLVELKSQDLRKTTGKKYILQVWRAGECLFERFLMHRIKQWSMNSVSIGCQGYSLIYVLDNRDTEDKYYYNIVCFNEVTGLKVKEYMIHDFYDFLLGLGALHGNIYSQMHDPQKLLKPAAMIKTGLNAIITSHDDTEEHRMDKLKLRITKFDNQLYFIVCDERTMYVCNISDTDKIKFNEGRDYLYQSALVLDLTRNEPQLRKVKLPENIRVLKLYESFSTEEQSKFIYAIFEIGKTRQLTFQKMKYKSVGSLNTGSKNFTVQFMEEIDQQKRRNQIAENDEIVICQHCEINQEDSITACIRKTGYIDLYWNCQLVWQSEMSGSKYQYTKLYLSFDHILLERTGGSLLNKYQAVKISLSSEQRITADDAITVPNIKRTGEGQRLHSWYSHFFKNQRIQAHFTPYQNYILHEDFLFLCHRSTISIYNIFEQKWESHTDLLKTDEVSESLDATVNKWSQMEIGQEVSGLSSKSVHTMFKQEQKGKDLSIGVLFKDGSFKIIQKTNQEQNSNEQPWSIQNVEGQIEGQIVSAVTDQEHQRSLYVLSKEVDNEGNEIGQNFYIFTSGKLHNQTTKMNEILKPGVQILPFYSPAQNTQFIIYDPNDQSLKSQDAEKDSMLKKFKPEDGSLRVYEHKIVNNKLALVKPYKILSKTLQRLFRYSEKSKIHTAMSTDLSKNIILVTDSDMIVLDIETCETIRQASNKSSDLISKVQVINNFKFHAGMGIVGTRLINDRFCYITHNQGAKNMAIKKYAAHQNSISLMDLDGINESYENSPMIIPITHAVAGASNQIQYSEANGRLVFLQSFNRLVLMPLLHRNVHSFECMPKVQDIIVSRVINHLFIVVDTHGYFHEFNIMTGKQNKPSIKLNKAHFSDSSKNLGDKDRQMEGYKIYSTGKSDSANNREKTMHLKGLHANTLIQNQEAEDNSDGKMTTYFYGERGQNALKESFHGKNIEGGDEYIGINESVKQHYFQFKLISITDESKIDIKMMFKFPKPKNRELHLLFAKDLTEECSRMISIRSDTAYLYEAVNDETHQGINKKIKLLNSLPQVPANLAEKDASILYSLFSPDFSEFIDIDTTNRQFVIRCTKTGLTNFSIPKEWLPLPVFEPQQCKQAKFMSWVDKNRIKVINVKAKLPVEAMITLPPSKAYLDFELKKSQRENQDQLFSIDPSDLKEYSDIENLEIVEEEKVDSYVRYKAGESGVRGSELEFGDQATVPFLETSEYLLRQNQNYEDNIPSSSKQSKGGNFYEYPFPLASDQLEQRLMRKHQKLKSVQYVGDREWEKEELKEGEGDILKYEAITSILMNVDYNVENSDKIMFEHSFTYLGLACMEKLESFIKSSEGNGDEIKNGFVKSCTRKMLIEIALQVGPRRETVYHFINRSYDVSCIFFDKLNEGAQDMFPVPFIRDLYGDTPLDQVLQTDATDSLVVEFFINKYLPHMPFDHHGREISQILHKLSQIPGFDQYFNSRFFETSYLDTVQRVPNHQLIKDDKDDMNNSICKSIRMWPNKVFLRDQFFESSKQDSRVTVHMCDIPGIHDPMDQRNKDLIESFAAIDSDDLDLFKCLAVKMTISYNWPIIKSYIIWNQFSLYCVFLVDYCVYSMGYYDFVNPIWDSKEGAELYLHISIAISLIVFSLYFLYIEGKQLYKKRCDYFESLWNLLDVIPPILIICVVLADCIKLDSPYSEELDKDQDGVLDSTLDIEEKESEIKKAEIISWLTMAYLVQSVTCMMMWFKIFFFLRIWRATGFFVNMLIKIMWETKTFCLLLLLILASFGCVFVLLGAVDGGIGAGFFSGLYYTYLIALGEFQIDGYETLPTTFLLTVFFLVATVITMIVMLNILIALVSDVYADVIQVQEQANDFELVNTIFEVSVLVSENIKKKLSIKNGYLTVAREASSRNCDQKSFDQTKEE